VPTAAVYVSTGAFPSRDLDAILDALELGDVATFDLTRVRKGPRPAQLLVHNYFPPPPEPFLLNLASRDAELLERSRAHCRAAIDLSQELGGPVYAAHGGYSADLAPKLLGRPELQAALPPGTFASPDETHAVVVESARELAQHAARRGVRFLVENHSLAAPAGETGRRLLPMVTPEELVRLCADVDVPGFGLLVDVGHLKVSAAALGFDPHAALDALAPHVGALHLSDNDGVTDLHRPFGDDAWFLPRLRDFPEVCVTIEVGRSDVRTILDVRDTVLRWR
jgi:sugar phosphate isomerase/epimerase